MGFKVRGYTREVPQEKVRDYYLFAIATEGTDREPDYFRLFDGIDEEIYVRIRGAKELVKRIEEKKITFKLK